MKIDYQKDLNPAQYEAVTTTSGPVLVIAGAGSGKTRTIVYRLAYLVEHEVSPQNILLLTFTRKAAGEMLKRAESLLGRGLLGVHSGTFHSFAYGMLRKFATALGYVNGITVMDSSDAEDLLKSVKEQLKIGQGDRSFPKKKTVLALISKARNKEMELEQVLLKEAYHLRGYAEDLERIYREYQLFKQKHGLLDYDDLLFQLERLLVEHDDIRDFLRQAFQYIMVDEFQDTNLVQGRLVKLIVGSEGNVMAVGDDAQSIYAFRGANVNNILNFPKIFKNAKIIKLEQNYRSTQPILNLTNQILAQATEKYPKNLFTKRKSSLKPQLIRPLSDLSQARVVVQKVIELTQKYSLHEIAVLFRAGYQSYPLEVELNRASIPFQKFGGIKFSEAAHIKDVLAFMRLVANPADLLAWTRGLSNLKGIGPKTCERLYSAFMQGNSQYIEKQCKKSKQLEHILNLLDELRSKQDSPAQILDEIVRFYQPIMQEKFADDYPKRATGLEQLAQIASAYDNLDIFLADMSLENPDPEGNKVKEDTLVLSTVHSAKGLEWSAVLIIDLVEERFPSKHALMDYDELEEERRLLYVACTRAKDYLALFVPDSIYNRYQDLHESVLPCPFIQELDNSLFEEWRENYLGSLVPTQNKKPRTKTLGQKSYGQGLGQRPDCRYCSHKIFGRGKVIAEIPPNKFKVNFPGFGLKTVIGDYLEFEE
ncbi:UvrD-helicase domain-containing protein [Desulfohalobiaceae bacterium Ax17]|jgi:DNA helicase-2/ATP-dependent DNA helicase PcrA|uniref:ATP-dependent helicase n=1 Tax=Desulfovulcanus ferrireducens TaxID=2831190 RepID=UPI00207BCACF|nr:ATP-dependent helicase [Desulfovulcanus ferrireducens]MBT8762589.1 UvrD-helicase domain-containing protein [Desulfovulcanus ferrireducens]